MMHFNCERSFAWLFSQEVAQVKELSRALMACQLWGQSKDMVPRLIRLKGDGSWNGSLRDTARAASALSGAGMMFPDVREWMLSKQNNNGAWNDDVYDTTYALTALADMGVANKEACQWLLDNYGSAWEHPGTTSLIIQSLILQSKLMDIPGATQFIHNRAEWLLSKRASEGAWENIATSNIVMHALMLAGYGSELKSAEQWILSKMNTNGSWGAKEGDITATALTLMTIAYARG